MASSVVPSLFRISCRDHGVYPVKLINRPRYGFPLLDRSRLRLAERQTHLNLFAPATDLFVPVLDVDSNGDVFDQNLRSEAELSQRLGDNFIPDPTDPQKVIGARPDVPCRFIFLVTAGTNKALEITSDGLKRILSYHQVMPSFLDFLYIYGSKDGDDREIVRFSSFKSEKDLINPLPALVAPGLKRSGKRYQICYCFKSVSLKTEQPEQLRNKTWKIRQAVFYHTFDIGEATQFWLIGDPAEHISDTVFDKLPRAQNFKRHYDGFSAAFKSTLDTHLLFVQRATEDWRWHVQSSEEIIDNTTQHFVSIISDPRNISWEPSALNITQEREEKIKDTILALESNVAILTRLRTFYSDLINDENFPNAHRIQAQRDVREFTSRIDEYIYDITLQITRAKLVAQLAKDRKDMLIQHLNAQNVMAMWEQAKKSGLDAVVMKIITVIAVIYLPATFVATFFSSNVVQYLDVPTSTNSTDGTPLASDGTPLAPEQISHTGIKRFFEIAIVLMVATFALAGVWYERERRQINKRDGPFMQKGYPV